MRTVSRQHTSKKLATGIALLAIFALLLSLVFVLSQVSKPFPSSADGLAAETDSFVTAGGCGFRFEQKRIWLFNGGMPYTGSIRNLVGSEQRMDWSLVVGRYGVCRRSYVDDRGNYAGSDSCGDFPGIYYRQFHELDWNGPWITLAVHFAYPLVGAVIFPGWVFWRRKRMIDA